jgi:crotonobetainyl-CoA:carnitine CoA-transferase CaiB-like acyl-CoA transferase
MSLPIGVPGPTRQTVSLSFLFSIVASRVSRAIGRRETGARAELLRPYRVLDLTNELGELAGRMLGDLGANVIKIEPPGGDPSRWRPPYYADTPDAERSLAWWASNVNKRSVVLGPRRRSGTKAVA